MPQDPSGILGAGAGGRPWLLRGAAPARSEGGAQGMGLLIAALGATLAAIVRKVASIPLRCALESISAGMGSRAAVEEMFRMRPRRCRRISGIAARMVWRGPQKWTAIASSKSPRCM